MATKYIEEFATTTDFLARAADRSNKLGVGSVSEILYVNRGGVAVPLLPQAWVVLTATKTVTAAENGTTFLLNSATEFVTTLPAPAAGLHYTFIVGAAPSGASYTVVTNASANIIKGAQTPVDGTAGDFGSTDDTISFVDGQAVAGDKCEVWSDGTSWFAYAVSKVAAGITFTTAS